MTTKVVEDVRRTPGYPSKFNAKPDTGSRPHFANHVARNGKVSAELHWYWREDRLMLARMHAEFRLDGALLVKD
jgi:hypothetical protein